MHGWDEFWEFVPRGEESTLAARYSDQDIRIKTFGSPGTAQKMEDPAMNRFLFLKADWSDRRNAPGRALSNAGIDPVLLLLLSARYM